MKIEEAILYLLAKKNGGMTTGQLAVEINRNRLIVLKDGVFHQRFSPRRKRSEFSALNYARCKRLERLGLMTDAGMAVIPAYIEQRLIPKEDIIAALYGDWNDGGRLLEE